MGLAVERDRHRRDLVAEHDAALLVDDLGEHVAAARRAGAAVGELEPRLADHLGRRPRRRDRDVDGVGRRRGRDRRARGGVARVDARAARSRARSAACRRAAGRRAWCATARRRRATRSPGRCRPTRHPRGGGAATPRSPSPAAPPGPEPVRHAPWPPQNQIILCGTPLRAQDRLVAHRLAGREQRVGGALEDQRRHAHAADERVARPARVEPRAVLGAEVPGRQAGGEGGGDVRVERAADPAGDSRPRSSRRRPAAVERRAPARLRRVLAVQRGQQRVPGDRGRDRVDALSIAAVTNSIPPA